MSDLSTLLHEHVTRSEPLVPPDPTPSIVAGRRRLRGRRTAVATTTAVVLAAAAAIALPAVVSDRVDGTGSGIDPATTRALADYDAREMPAILEEHVSAVLGRSVADLPPANFYAGDGQGQKLDPDDYDKASGMSVSYGDDSEHRFSVSLSHARSEAEGNAREVCATELDEGLYVSCDVSVTDAGDVVISRVTALRELPMLDQSAASWMVVNTKQLDDGDPDRLWFSHDVKVVHSETFLTYASEIVKAPSLDAANALFEVPVADLVEIGTDPALVIPPPPTDDSGCGPWTQDDGVTYSC